MYRFKDELGNRPLEIVYCPSPKQYYLSKYQETLRYGQRMGISAETEQNSAERIVKAKGVNQRYAQKFLTLNDFRQAVTSKDIPRSIKQHRITRKKHNLYVTHNFKRVLTGLTTKRIFLRHSCRPTSWFSYPLSFKKLLSTE